MMLRRRVLLTSLAIAVPAAVLLTAVVEWTRGRDMRLALERVVRSQINEQVRERCESDPNWFLTGPLIGRPRGGVFTDPNPDALAPRPRVDPQPFELFAYDEQLRGSSTAAPRLPQEFRAPLRTDGYVAAPFATDEGRGRQFAVATGWTGGPCVYLLGRMRPPSGQTTQRAGIFLLTLASCFGVALLTSVESVVRVRRLAREAKQAVDAGYAPIAPDKLRDELSSLTFVYNDMATELQDRRKAIEDQENALRRFVQTTADEVAAPLAALETEIDRIESREGTGSHDRLRVVQAQSHDLAARIDNLAAAARLKMAATPSIERIDLNALVSRIADRHMPMARAAGVTLHVSVPRDVVVIRADQPLVERAISNVVDNAVRYNKPGGTAAIALRRDDVPGRFTLRVTDSGQGVTDDQFKALTAVHRFRGDEGRNRRPGSLGLGLAVAREVADRFDLTLELRRPAAGGLEVEMTGACE